MLSIYLSLQDF
ncbi:hypothetical protein D050_4770A, partial [Vibrio parahaemolyticus VPCR-2009]